MTRSVDDLRELLELVERAYFTDPHALAGVTIRWGRWLRTKRWFRYAAYHHNARIIEIHPALADESVPEYVLVSTIYHEALHAIHGHDHSPAFLRDETCTPVYAMSAAWERQNTARLMALKPDGRVK